MLPSVLVSTYQTYKQDTDSIAAWLASTARSAGFSADLLSPVTASVVKSGFSGRLKGKARSQAKKKGGPSRAPSAPGGPNYIIGVKDFISLAEYVAGKAIPVPGTFGATIDRVIAARSSFGTKLEEHGEALAGKSVATHAYFVGVLEKVREVLRPLMPAHDLGPTVSTASYLGNRFGSLALYEPSQHFLDSPDVERPAKVHDDSATYEVEAETSLEHAIFAMTVLINDMNRVKAHIIWIWSNYKSGNFDLAAAALATNTAIDLVRHMQDDILPLLGKHGGVGTMLQNCYVLQCLEKGWKAENLLVAGNDNFNYETYDIAKGTYCMAHRLLNSFPPILQPNQLPLYKEGMFGHYDPASDRSRKTGRQKFEDDRALIMPFFTELMTVVRGVGNWPVKDEFLRGMQDLDKTNQVPFYAVFAAQVFLDITYKLGDDIQRAFHTLMDQITVMDNDIKSHFEFHDKLKIENWPASNDHWLRGVHHSIQSINKDHLREIQVRAYQRSGVPPPNTESHRIFRMSPVICGLMLYRIRHQYREVGYAVANAWGSIQSCEHLHNAVRRQHLMTGMWSDMEIVRSNLADESFYVGGEAPETPAEQFKKFCLQMGVSAAAMSKSRRKNTAMASKAGPRGLKEASPVLTMFKARYVENGDRMSFTPDDVDQIIGLSLFESENIKEDGAFSMGQIEDLGKLKEKKKRLHQKDGSFPRKRTAKGSRIAVDQLIEPLTLALHAETLEFSFPYLHMHRQCWLVLRAVKESCDSVLRQMYTPAYLERETELPFVVGWILQAASGIEGGISILQPLQKAAEALNKFIEGGSGDFIVTHVLGKLYGMPVEFRLEENSDNGEDSDDEEDSDDNAIVTDHSLFSTPVD